MRARSANTLPAEAAMVRSMEQTERLTTDRASGCVGNPQWLVPEIIDARVVDINRCPLDFKLKPFSQGYNQKNVLSSFRVASSWRHQACSALLDWYIVQERGCCVDQFHCIIIGCSPNPVRLKLGDCNACPRRKGFGNGTVLLMKLAVWTILTESVLKSVKPLSCIFITVKVEHKRTHLHKVEDITSVNMTDTKAQASALLAKQKNAYPGQNDDLTIGCPKRASDCPSRIKRYPSPRAKHASNFVTVHEDVGEKKEL